LYRILGRDSPTPPSSPPPDASQLVLAQNALAHPAKWRHFLDAKADTASPLNKNWPDLKDHKGRAIWLNNYMLGKDIRGALKNMINAKVIEAADMLVVD
jgi:hypothetical protein